MSKWQLPDGIDELVGLQSESFEKIRRSLLDLYKSYGYQLVIPPMVEYVDTLEPDCESTKQKMFKFIDPASGKMLGVHADNTPQISRIDARKDNNSVNRYCYINSILKTQADDFYASRSPIQAGVELYGFNGIEADIEVIEIMILSILEMGIKNLVLCLGDASIFNKLVNLSALNKEQVAKLKNIFRRKSIPDLDYFLEKNDIENADKFKFLISLVGDKSSLNKAREYFYDIEDILKSIDSLEYLSSSLSYLDIEVIFDIGELKSYDYHNGLVFAIYHKDFFKSLAQGGRYNNVFSHDKNRFATGFSMDLKFLMQQRQLSTKNKDKTIIAPNINDNSLKKFILELRNKGFVVEVDMLNTKKTNIIKVDNKWTIKN